MAVGGEAQSGVAGAGGQPPADAAGAGGESQAIDAAAEAPDGRAEERPDAAGGQCAFRGGSWKSGLQACPGSSGGLCTSGDIFRSDGCFFSSVCASDIQNTACQESIGHWTQTECGRLDVTLCDGTTSAYSSSDVMSDVGAAQDGGSLKSCSCGGPDIFEGAAWKGTLTEKATCASTSSMTYVMDSITFQPTASGFSYTDQYGCVLDFSVSGYDAMLANAPVMCNVSTDAGVEVLKYTSALLHTSDGLSMGVSVQGSLTAGQTSCAIAYIGTLKR
jgi:hypothetical protein